MNKKTNEVILLLEKFFVDYLPNTRGLSNNTITAYQYAFQLFFQYLQTVKGLSPEKVTFNSLTGDTINDFLLYLEHKRGCSVKTRNLRRAAILAFAKYASNESFSSALSFYTNVSETPRKKEPAEIGFKHFTKEEISILLRLPDTTRSIGQRDLTLLSLLYATGARAQELCDITLGCILIGSPSRIRLTGKGNKSRIVAIPDSCTAILKQYLKSRNFNLASPTTHNRHLFSSQMNEHMSIACVEEIVKKYVKEAKRQNPQLFMEKHYSPHSFRHSIAVHMLEAGDSLVAIRAFLGHSSIATTCIYAKVTPELAAKYLNERGRPLECAAKENKFQSLPQALPFLYRS